MKWNKFDPENPPNKTALFRFKYTYGINFHFGCWVKNYGCIFYEDAEPCYYTEDDMYKFDARWIYPQDLEMPE